VLPILHLAAYRFVPLDDLADMRQRLLQSAAAAALKGTVLLAPEGINLFLAGEPGSLRAWFDGLRREPHFAPLQARLTHSSALPFRRLRVRIKREIIRMDQPSVRPTLGRAPSVDAATLARWLSQGRCDAGRELVLLDTRNGFEVDQGAFEGAIDWRLRKFSEFPAALAAHRARLEGKTIVSYCTGGIRCEKAALWMREQGLAHTMQLEGGILGYFEGVPGAPHFRGHCFVFDEREALDSQLEAAA